MSELRIFVDFNNRDSDGFLRLNLTGTLEDLRRGQLLLEEGMPATGSDGDLTAKIIVVAPGTEGVWRGGALKVLGRRGHKLVPVVGSIGRCSLPVRGKQEPSPNDKPVGFRILPKEGAASGR